MYPVTNEFKEAVMKNNRSYYWTGQITTKTNKIYDFSQEDIVKGSGYIVAQCANNSEIEIGTVYAAEAGISLMLPIDRYTLEEAELEVFYHLKINDLKEERISMGKFIISEANRTAHFIEIKAYDNMILFEKKINETYFDGTPYDIIEHCCNECKVEFANLKSDISNMPNGEAIVGTYNDNDIETYRDVLHYISQILGGFFLINRKGQLELKKYGTTEVLTLNQTHRYSSSISDFITRYTAVSSTNIITQKSEYYALEEDNGLTMNLEVNPFLQYGLDETRASLCRNILEDIAKIEYVPFDIEMIGNPALEVGDVIVLSGGQADKLKKTCITYINTKIGGRQSIRCVGKNPRLFRVKSKNDKNISGLLNSVESGKIGIHTFTNTLEYKIGADLYKIVDIEYASTEDNHAQFIGGILIDVVADPEVKTVVVKGQAVMPNQENTDSGGNISPGENTDSGSNISQQDQEVQGETNPNNGMIDINIPVEIPLDGKVVCYIIYELNDSVIETYKPIETYCSGKHIIPLYFPIKKILPNVTNSFRVYMRVENGTCDVCEGGCLASITGQSMAATAEWDGKLTFVEEVNRFVLGGGLKAIKLADDFDIESKIEVKREYSELLIGRTKIGALSKPFNV